MWVPTDIRNKQPVPAKTETMQLFIDKKQEQLPVTWMTPQGHFRERKCQTSSKYSYTQLELSV